VNSDSRRRVVVTGIGAISPIGNTVQETWSGLCEGRSGVGKITFELTPQPNCPVEIAAEIKNFDPFETFPPLRPRAREGDLTEITTAINKKDLKKFGRFTHLAACAGVQAYRDSKLDEARTLLDPERMGVNIGVGMGGLYEIETSHVELINRGWRRISPFMIPQIIPNMASGLLSIILNAKGPNLCNVTACSSSAHSIGESTRLIRQGAVDVMITGGAEAVISSLAIGGFAAMRALSTRNNEPEKASRPFDKGRDGFVIGEGSAVLILEELEFAKKRGAPIYAEILGYGLSGDAYHITAPAPEGDGGYRAMEMALKDASLSPAKIDYINAHGTSTPAGDTEEAQAVARLFKDHIDKLHVSSTKSMIGHLLGAAGAIEALVCLLAIRDGKIPPTINLDDIDEKCAQTGLNFTPHKMVQKEVRYALSNSFGFGGTNATLILGKYN